MLRKLGWVAAGLGAFVVASVGVNLLSMVVSALIPGASEDKPGKLEPDPQQQSKAEWLQQLEGGGPTETKETKTETQTEAAPKAAQQPAASPATEPAPVFQPANPAPMAAPPAPRVGPGNYDAPSPYTAPPVIQSGPGNM
jgi:hypothetical protein